MTTCRRCSVCEGAAHHWMPDCDLADPPTYDHVCTHCNAVGITCDLCDGEGVYEGDDDVVCPGCDGEGVLYLREKPDQEADKRLRAFG